VIAGLQKLSIPYELAAGGNQILVPAPQLAQARLQLGMADVPGSDETTAWQKLEDAPMTASDRAQDAMAVQALESSLQTTIEEMNGVKAAQVFLALPPDTPFLADQPKPTASVVIQADDGQAQAQGRAIAELIAGAVPGLSSADVTVETTSGLTVFPAGGRMQAGTEFATQAQVETQAAARIAGLLIPLIGAGNFQTDVSANLDFTQTKVHQVAYGPVHLVSHQTSSLSDHWGAGSGLADIGIPGALSNEPPSATKAVPPGQSAGASTQSGGASTQSGAAAASAQGTPTQTSSQLDQTYLTDQSDSDISAPDWTVKSMAVSVVLDKAAMGNVTIDQVKAAIAGAFAYPSVNVSVLAANFRAPVHNFNAGPIARAAGPLTQALLELMAAAALLFGLAMPVGKRLANVNLRVLFPPQPRPIPVVLPPRDFSDLKMQAAENIPGVAKLLQSWVEDSE
jgi:flagellar M-ring protein FliF